MARAFHKWKKKKRKYTLARKPWSLNVKDHLVNSGVFNISRPTNASIDAYDLDLINTTTKTT